jgi:energy-coupling factor transport system ATP-binding protein
VLLLARGRLLVDGPVADVLAGGWYFATEAARITDGAAVDIAAAARLIAPERGRVPGERELSS